MYVNSYSGLGQDLTDEIGDAFDASDPSTGLPIAFELGFALLIGIYIWSWAGGVNKTYKRAKRKRAPRRRATA
jgi:hypothetical protein